MLDQTEYFTCTCGAPNHTLRFILDLDETSIKLERIPVPTIYTEVMLSHYLPWYKRIYVGIKYMFGMDTVDHFGGWEIHQVDADRMIDMLSKLKDANTKYLAERNLNKDKDKDKDDADLSIYGDGDYEQHGS